MTFAQSELSSLKNCEKPAQQIGSRAVADLAYHVLLRTLMKSMIWCSAWRVHQGHTMDHEHGTVCQPILDHQMTLCSFRLHLKAHLFQQ